MGELMDPDETLRLAREAAERAQGLIGEDYADLVSTALSYYWSLDQWMSKGGVRPQEWTPWGSMWPQ